MRKLILGTASALALASPAVAADLPLPPYNEVPGYEGEAYTSGYGAAPPVVVEESPAVVVVRPPVVVPPPVVVEDYPVYAERAYAYGGPVWHGGWGWGRRHHFHNGW